MSLSTGRGNPAFPRVTKIPRSGQVLWVPGKALTLNGQEKYKNEG